MDTHDEMEAVFNADKKMFFIIDIKVEFSLQGVVYQDTSFNAYLVTFWVPSGLKSNWHTIPPVWVYLS